MAIRTRSQRVPFKRIRDLTHRAIWHLTDRIYPATPPPVSLRPAANGQPLRIAFVVCEIGKWAHQSLFDTLARTPGLDLRFVLVPSDVALRMSARARAACQAQQMAAFAARGPVENLLLPGDQLRDLSTLDADLIFLQQPWGMQDAPRRLTGRIACAHISYEMGVIDDPFQQFALPHFHRWLWRLFVPSAQHVQMLARVPGAVTPERVVASGSPRLEAWHQKLGTGQTTGPDPTHVVWAPHHALGQDSLRLGTFEWSAPAMLDLAHNTPETRFILRPHPNLWRALERRQAGAARRFRDRWTALPNTGMSEHEDPLPVLSAASALITDSVTFLAEFMMTARPVLRLTRADGCPLSEFGATLEPGFYPCPDAQSLRQTFATVVQAGQDPLADIRMSLARRLTTPAGLTPSEIIRDEILTALGQDAGHARIGGG